MQGDHGVGGLLVTTKQHNKNNIIYWNSVSYEKYNFLLPISLHVHYIAKII